MMRAQLAAATACDILAHSIQELLKWMLQREPRKRPTADDILQHPWTASHRGSLPQFLLTNVTASALEELNRDFLVSETSMDSIRDADLGKQGPQFRGATLDGSPPLVLHSSRKVSRADTPMEVKEHDTDTQKPPHVEAATNVVAKLPIAEKVGEGGQQKSAARESHIHGGLARAGRAIITGR